MKKHMVIAALLAGGIFCAQPEAKAQGAYVKLGGAYNFGAGSEIDYNQSSVTISNMNGSNYSTEYEAVKVNYGKGIVAGGTIGYMFNPNFGAELGIGYLLGGTNKQEGTHTYNGAIETFENEGYSRMLLLQPSLVISAGMDGINPYARFGVVAAKGSVTQKGMETNDGDKFETEINLSGGWGLGLQGGIGAEFKLSDNLAFFTELTMSNLSYAPEKGEITKASYNGRDVLGEMTTREKETTFEDNLTYNSNSNNPDSEPDTNMKFNMPFSSVGVGLGIKMSF